MPRKQVSDVEKEALLLHDMWMFGLVVFCMFIFTAILVFWSMFGFAFGTFVVMMMYSRMFLITKKKYEKIEVR